MSPILLSYQDVADALGVTKITVRRMVDAGTLPRVMIGTATPRVRATDLQAWIDSRVEIVVPISSAKPKRPVGRPRKADLSGKRQAAATPA